MMSMKRLACGAALTVRCWPVCGTAAYAQETTARHPRPGGGPDGKPAANATVTITHVPTGTTVTLRDRPNGLYNSRGLRVGGPYASRPRRRPERDAQCCRRSASAIPSRSTSPSSQRSRNWSSRPPRPTARTTAARRTRFGLADIQELPSLKRDLKDVARLNPFVTLDPSNLDAVIAGGVSSRFNQLTVDGVKQNDDFGLNNNGYPTQRSPISTDAVQAMSVNLAPYSVLYNDFQGANINVVTKSGTNDFHGTRVLRILERGPDRRQARKGVLTVLQRLQGKDLRRHARRPDHQGSAVLLRLLRKVQGQPRHDRRARSARASRSSPATRTPIRPSSRPPRSRSSRARWRAATASTSTPRTRSSATFPCRRTTRRSSPRSTGTSPTTTAWRVTYQKTNGTRLIEGNRSSSTQLALYSDYYIKGDDLEVYTAQLNSDWTDNFRTELVATRKKVVTLQQPVAGADGNGDGGRRRRGGNRPVLDRRQPGGRRHRHADPGRPGHLAPRQRAGKQGHDLSRPRLLRPGRPLVHGRRGAREARRSSTSSASGPKASSPTTASPTCRAAS